MVSIDTFAIDAWRIGAAILVMLGYALFCAHLFRKARRAALASPPSPHAGAPKPAWVIYASQSGQAEALARHAVEALQASGSAAMLWRIDQPWLDTVEQAGRLLFVVSTYGEGAAPDHARGFARGFAAAQPALRGLRFGMLALGDRNYPDFCAFGRSLDQWLQASGAIPEFPRIEADRLDAQAMAAWTQQLQRLGSKVMAAPPKEAETPAYSAWRLLTRECLNSGSPASPMFKLTLQPSAGSMPAWQAGDLVDILIPKGDGQPRSYSIANLPEDGHLELIVRTVIREDGTLGQTSGWLNQHAYPGDELALKIRHNPGFNLQAGLAKPLILIGAGAGIAGLRGHLQARARAKTLAGAAAPAHGAWLLFGERSARHDRPCRAEIEAWQHRHVLMQLDLAFSRDEANPTYVQDRLLSHADDVRKWVADGADILICGCARTMAHGVDQALRTILGNEHTDALLASGRIRRDIF